MTPLSSEHNKKAMRSLHNEGIEMTEEELVATRKIAYANIRKEMAKHGYSMPESDEEMFLVLQASLQRRKNRG